MLEGSPGDRSIASYYDGNSGSVPKAHSGSVPIGADALRSGAVNVNLSSVLDCGTLNRCRC